MVCRTLGAGLNGMNVRPCQGPPLQPPVGSQPSNPQPGTNSARELENHFLIKTTRYMQLFNLVSKPLLRELGLITDHIPNILICRNFHQKGDWLK